MPYPKQIFLSPPHMSGNEQGFIQRAFEENYISTAGINLLDFEKKIKQALNTNLDVLALNSATSAIHLALIMLNVGSDDLVITQSFTFCASANPILYQGAIPVFIDSEKETWNMCPLLLEKAIKEAIEKGKKPKAILTVHLYGMPYKVKEIHHLAEKYEIPILEDAAEALGSNYKGTACGTFGKYSVISFNGSKIITTSGGGALICPSESTKEKALYYATQAKESQPYYEHKEIGYNYRLSNISAGIGLGQLTVLEERVYQRRSNFEFYKKELNSLETISFLEEGAKIKSNRWLTTILTDSFETREKIRLALKQENIESRPLWKPMHMQPVFKNAPFYGNGTCEELFEKGLCLPSGSNLTPNDLDRVCAGIKKAL